MNQDAVQSAIRRGLVSEAHAALFFEIETAPEKPAAEAASSGTNVEPVQRRQYDIHPAMLAIARARRTLYRDEAARKLQNITGQLT